MNTYATQGSWKVLSLLEVNPVIPGDPDWKLSSCAKAVELEGADPDDWFPDVAEQRDRAKAVCKSCPIKKDCRKYADENGLVGYWGGRLFGPALSQPDPDPLKSHTTSRNREKTCCPKGHKYDLILNNGRRACSKCRRAAGKRAYRRNSGKNPEWKRMYLAPEDRVEVKGRVLAMFDYGYTTGRIASELQVSTRTVNRYTKEKRDEY